MENSLKRNTSFPIMVKYWETSTNDTLLSHFRWAGQVSPAWGTPWERDSKSFSFTIFRALQDVVWSCLWFQKVADNVQVPLRTSHKKHNLFSLGKEKKEGSPSFLVDVLWFQRADMKVVRFVFLFLTTLYKSPLILQLW